MTPMASPTAYSSPRLGLRERKKIRTRQAIRKAAYRLFEEQGYDGTTVEQIAEAAEVSPSTVFRYFPTKEDIVLTDEYDPMMIAALKDRPADEPLIESLRQAVLEPLREMIETEREEILQRMRLVRAVPAIRARQAEQMYDSGTALGEALAERAGRPANDLEIRVLIGALMGAWTEAIYRWADDDGREDLATVLDRAVGVLSSNMCRHRI